MNATEFGLWLDSLDFEREVPFRGISGKRRWRFDYARPELMLAVEYDGIMSYGPSHTSISGIMRDAEKSTDAAICGWMLLRVNAKTIGSGVAQRWVELAIETREAEMAATA